MPATQQSTPGSGEPVPLSAATTTAALDPQSSKYRGGGWIDDWNPEDENYWRRIGKKVAQRNLWPSIYAEFLGFVVWALWSIVVPKLNDYGFAFTEDEKFWLISIPSLVGATLRIPYTLAVPVFGGRNWTIVSALLLLIPSGALAWAVSNPDTSFTTMILIAALAGFGGGNFSSSMANISFFFPEREKGKALGLNAAGGNIGTAAVQAVVPLVIVIGGGLHLERAGLMMIPFILLAAFLAWRLMNNLTTAKADPRTFGAAVKNRHTWIISFLYIGTFGSFIGYSWAFPTLLKTLFPDRPLQIAFMGALVGSVSRPFGGILADKIGGTKITIVSFLMMSAGAFGAIQAINSKSFVLFFVSFLWLFIFTGVGNGATYRMIPAVFQINAVDRTKGMAADAVEAAKLMARKASAGCIGIAGAIGAFGGFLVPRIFAMSKSHSDSFVPAMWGFIIAYLVMIVVAWFVYMRKGSALAAANI